MTGASGGMIGASYFRALYLEKQQGMLINLHDSTYTERAARDVLNSVFTSMAVNDFITPFRSFRIDNNLYAKDRGYAFEQKLNDNTHGILDHPLGDYYEDEANANIPLMLFHPVITRDGRKLIISSQPVSFLMKPLTDSASTVDPDGVDFAALFHQQDPMHLRMLTVLRMNATFPYVLPNVWLPSKPVIDVMDAGLRDNLGTETSLRFIDNFKEWIKENTGSVVLLQLKDRMNDDWALDPEVASLTDMIVTPATMLQHNWFALQNYFQADQYSYFNNNQDSLLKKISIVYKPASKDKGAALNFHLSAREKRDIMLSFYSDVNAEAVKTMRTLLKK
jgi:hypothetical protein